MATSVTSTEAVRSFGDLLARVKHAGESFVVTKSNKPIARLVPVHPSARARGGEIMNALVGLPKDPDFASDLERVNGLDRLPQNPWDS